MGRVFIANSLKLHYKKLNIELYDYIKINNGKIFINNDDTFLNEISKDIDSISYGLNGEINGSIKESSIFTNVQYKSHIIETQLIGTYQFYNISFYSNLISLPDYLF